MASHEEHEEVQFQQRESIWKLISDIAKDEEQLEVKKILGVSLVDETIDLHREVETLIEIWKELRVSAGQGDPISQLSEPPAMRTNLEKRISLLVEMLDQKSRKTGRKLSEVLKEEDMSMIDKVMKDANNNLAETIGERVRSSSSGYGSSRCSDTIPSSRCSSSLSVDLDSLEGSINVQRIDDVITHLIKDLEDERDGLFEDIQYIQNTMIDERTQQERKEIERLTTPTLSDLRSLGTKLEKAVLDDDSPRLYPKQNHSRDNTESRSVKHRDSTTKSKPALSQADERPMGYPQQRRVSDQHTRRTPPSSPKVKSVTSSENQLMRKNTPPLPSIGHARVPSLEGDDVDDLQEFAFSNQSTKPKRTPTPPQSEKLPSSTRGSFSANRFRNLVSSYRDDDS